MSKTVRIFKSWEEQEIYHKDLMLQTTVIERFKKLYQMQQMTKLLRPVTDNTRKIQIRKWVPLEEL
jgi:hypothetical protein